MATFWLLFGTFCNFLVPFSQLFGPILATFWVLFGNFSAIFRLLFDHFFGQFSAIVRPFFGMIMATFRPFFGLFSSTFQLYFLTILNPISDHVVYEWSLFSLSWQFLIHYSLPAIIQTEIFPRQNLQISNRIQRFRCRL